MQLAFFCFTVAFSVANAQTSACTTCHRAQVLDGPHASFDNNCVACHGDGEAHIAQPTAGGILTFSHEPTKEKEAPCAACHRDAHTSGTSAHRRAGVACNDCHSIHTSPESTSALVPMSDLNRLSSESRMCYGCHEDVFAEFRFDERHRLTENALTCTSCHDPHGSSRRSRLSGARDERCANCHAAQDGPFVFEHDASRVDGCVACHAPHGDPNRRLLAHQESGELCYSCHADVPQFHLGFSPAAPVRFGTDTVCTNCHVTIHGSNLDRNFLK